MPKYIAGAIEDIPPGSRKIVEIGGRSIGLFNVNGTVYALRNRCPHQGGPLCEGRHTGFLEATAPGEFQYTRRGEFLRCPWHGWEFDITTGRSWVDPARLRTSRYPVSVQIGSALEDQSVPVNLQVETYPVAVDKAYIVVELP